MPSLWKITPWVAVVVFLHGVVTSTTACHVQIHYTKAQIEAADLRLYDRDVSERNRDITSFDQKHSRIGALLGSQQVYEQELEERNAHPLRFGYLYPALSKVLEGDMLYHEKHPFSIPIASINPPLPLPPAFLDPGSPSETPPPASSAQPGAGAAAAVPEPASAVLWLTTLIIGLIVASRFPRLTQVTHETSDLNDALLPPI